MTNQCFHNILLMGRHGIAGVTETLVAIKDYLLHHRVGVSLEASSAQMLDVKDIPIVYKNNIPSNCDLVIVVGGDGSLLSAVHISLPHNIPVLGINRGRLGFLTDIHPDDLTKISEVLTGRYQEESRFLLDGEIHLDGEIEVLGSALNDVVLLPGDIAQMIEFETYINDKFVCAQRADGLIVATPTGSTAYALSGGGPILHPQLDAIVLVPMFPHTLSSRPLVVSGNSVIEVIISKSNESPPYVSCDGQQRVSILPGSKLHIRKMKNKLRLIHPEDYNYFKTLREKLGWHNITNRA